MAEIDGSNAIGNIGGPSPPVASERLAYRGGKIKKTIKTVAGIAGKWHSRKVNKKKSKQKAIAKQKA